MTKLTNEEYAGRLRKLADVYATNPDAVQPYEMQADHASLLFCHNQTQVEATIRAFGPGKKEDAEGTIKYVPNLWPEINIHIFKHDCCKRIQVGTKTIPERVIPAQEATAARVVPEREEPVYEWFCGSLLHKEEPVLHVPEIEAIPVEF